MSIKNRREALNAATFSANNLLTSEILERADEFLAWLEAEETAQADPPKTTYAWKNSRYALVYRFVGDSQEGHVLSDNGQWLTAYAERGDIWDYSFGPYSAAPAKVREQIDTSREYNE